jgi:hypothetical protein
MKETFIIIAYNAIRMYVGTGLFDRISAEAKNLIFTNMPGQEKMNHLKTFFMREGIIVSGIIRDLIVSIVRLRFEA